MVSKTTLLLVLEKFTRAYLFQIALEIMQIHLEDVFAEDKTSFRILLCLANFAIRILKCKRQISQK